MTGRQQLASAYCWCTPLCTQRQRQESVVASQINRQSNPPVGRQKVRGITGRSSVVSASLWAANKTIEKAVLCIDNVSLDCNKDDIRAYVTHLGAEIFTCFKTKPRRRYDKSIDDVKDRNAFRICVNAQDHDRLLNSFMWPDSVRVSDWFKSNMRSQPGICQWQKTTYGEFGEGGKCYLLARLYWYQQQQQEYCRQRYTIRPWLQHDKTLR